MMIHKSFVHYLMHRLNGETPPGMKGDLEKRPTGNPSIEQLKALFSSADCNAAYSRYKRTTRMPHTRERSGCRRACSKTSGPAHATRGTRCTPPPVSLKLPASL